MTPATRRRYLYRCAIGICLVYILMQASNCEAKSGLVYRVEIQGIDDRNLLKLLKSVSESVTLQKHLPLSINLLNRRVGKDVLTFSKVMRSQGYYDARISYQIDSDRTPIGVVFQIIPGPPYRLEAVDIRLSGDETAGKMRVQLLETLGLDLGKPALSQPIRDIQRTIQRFLEAEGFPFATVNPPQAVVDHRRRSVSVLYPVSTGDRANFGETQIEGLSSVKEAFVRARIAWKKGDRYNSKLTEETQKRLVATGLFATVQIKTAEALDPQGLLAVQILLRERKHRTVSLGASYKTDEGFGGRIAWEHRNIAGAGERLSFEGTASGITTAIEEKFRKPGFLRSDQALLVNTRLADDHPDAYNSQNMTSIVQIERSLSKRLKIAMGPAYRYTETDQFGQEDRFGLVYFPLNLDWDTSDQLLDPSRGMRLNVQMEPYYDTLGTGIGFVRGYARFSRYFKFAKEFPIVLGFRGTMGVMGGVEQDRIPADIRFYAGGGGTIRGYAYQSVGPLQNNTPAGGRSLFCVSGELRLRTTDTIGLVAFVDGGSAFESVFPNFNETIRWGAGVGIRYFSKLGPIRLDVALPLNRRPGIDDAFQVYVSLGQAF